MLDKNQISSPIKVQGNLSQNVRGAQTVEEVRGLCHNAMANQGLQGADDGTFQPPKNLAVERQAFHLLAFIKGKPQIFLATTNEDMERQVNQAIANAGASDADVYIPQLDT